MKVAPLHRAFNTNPNIQSLIVHTGQHYDPAMSDIFFKQLEMPKPDYFLGIGGGTHTEQTAKIMLAFEKILQDEKPDVVLVVGDVNSTIACALVAVKMQIAVAHVEAGLRSNDRTMPEEINRILTDSISDWLFVTEQAGLDNLKNEGVYSEKIYFVGNTMIDSLAFYLPKINDIELPENIVKANLKKSDYILVTMHRPSNVDTLEGLKNTISVIELAAKHKKVVLPLHPRTKNNLTNFNLSSRIFENRNIIITEPLGYLPFVSLMKDAWLVLTDSGGIQEETTFLQIPCLTFRKSTERPITVEVGTNTMINELNLTIVEEKIKELLAGTYKKGEIPDLWDGHTAERIMEILLIKK
jgi:UDP-N-acetylglucosamine 2-epimerase (non-hydrolysing)